MSSNDKELFLLCVASGFLGAIAFILGRSIEKAQQQQKRHLEDARIRFEYEQKDSDERGDV